MVSLPRQLIEEAEGRVTPRRRFITLTPASGCAYFGRERIGRSNLETSGMNSTEMFSTEALAFFLLLLTRRLLFFGVSLRFSVHILTNKGGNDRHAHMFAYLLWSYS